MLISDRIYINIVVDWAGAGIFCYVVEKLISTFQFFFVLSMNYAAYIIKYALLSMHLFSNATFQSIPSVSVMHQNLIDTYLYMFTSLKICLKHDLL